MVEKKESRKREFDEYRITCFIVCTIGFFISTNIIKGYFFKNLPFFCFLFFLTIFIFSGSLFLSFHLLDKIQIQTKYGGDKKD